MFDILASLPSKKWRRVVHVNIQSVVCGYVKSVECPFKKQATSSESREVLLVFLCKV